MTPDTIPQFSAVYAEASVAWLETEIPQAILWIDDEERWDFTPADDDLPPSQVAFILQKGWDGMLTIENETDPQADDYDSLALTAEIAEQMEEEGVARSLLEALSQRRDRLADGEEEEDQDEDGHFSRQPLADRDDIE